jgi:hypothetical protein
LSWDNVPRHFPTSNANLLGNLDNIAAHLSPFFPSQMGVGVGITMPAVAQTNADQWNWDQSHSKTDVIKLKPHVPE